MSPSTSSRTHGPGPVSRALDPYRDRLINHSLAFTLASLAFARATVAGQASFNQPSPERTAALAALGRWQSDARQARTHIRAVSSGATGRTVAMQWLDTLNTTLGHFHDSLSLADPQSASSAAQLARQGIDESHRLADHLAQVIG